MSHKRNPMMRDPNSVIQFSEPAPKMKPYNEEAGVAITPAASKARLEALQRQANELSGHIRHHFVEQAAYFRWLNAGCPKGTADQDWSAAEHEIDSRPTPAPGLDRVRELLNAK